MPENRENLGMGVLRDGRVWAGFRQATDGLVDSLMCCEYSPVTQWGNRDRSSVLWNQPAFWQHHGLLRGGSLAPVLCWELRGVLCWTAIQDSLTISQSSWEKLKLMESVQIWNRREAFVILDPPTHGNLIVNLNFLLTWQGKGAVGLYTQAFTGAGVSTMDQVFRSVYMFKKKKDWM